MQIQEKGIVTNNVGNKRIISNSNSNLDNKMNKYSRVVKGIYEGYKRAEAVMLPIIYAFEEVAVTMDDKDTRKIEIIDCWNLLKSIVHEDKLITNIKENNNNRDNNNNAKYISPNLYHEKYVKNSKEMKRYLIKGAKTFLEQQYIRLMKTQIANYPMQAMVGPIPSMIDTIKAFLRVKYREGWPIELELYDEIPIWGIIYFSIRTGHIDIALQYAQSIPDSKLGNFVNYLSDYYHNDGKLQEQKWNEIQREYKIYLSTNRNNTTCDPYKLIVYNIIGRCEVNKSFSTICNTTQDFMWLKLTLVRETDDILPVQFQHCDYPLSKLQNVILEYGPDHFSKNGRNPLLYVHVLLLSLQFERAIQYLSSIDFYTVEVIHFALSLYHYGLLLSPSDLSTITTTNTNDITTIDFVRMLRLYVSNFQHTNTIEAVYYYSLLKDTPITILPNNTQQDTSTTIYNYYPTTVTVKDVCLKDLLIETHEYELLLGNGIRNGILDDLFGKERTQLIIELAAIETEQQGKYEDAVLLFEIAKNYTKVLNLLITQLGRTVTQRTSERDRLVTIALSIYQKQQQHNILTTQIRDRNLNITFEQLLALVSFFDLYTSGRYIDALNYIDNLDLLPFDIKTMDKNVETFKLLDQSIKRNISDILVAVMDILYKIYGNLKTSSSTNFNNKDIGGKEQKLQEIRMKARCLVMFSGMIQFKISGDVTSKLVRTECLMTS